MFLRPWFYPRKKASRIFIRQFFAHGCVQSSLLRSGLSGKIFLNSHPEMKIILLRSLVFSATSHVSSYWIYNFSSAADVLGSIVHISTLMPKPSKVLKDHPHLYKIHVEFNIWYPRQLPALVTLILVRPMYVSNWSSSNPWSNPIRYPLSG